MLFHILRHSKEVDICGIKIPLMEKSIDLSPHEERPVIEGLEGLASPQVEDDAEEGTPAGMKHQVNVATKRLQISCASPFRSVLDERHQSEFMVGGERFEKMVYAEAISPVRGVGEA